MAQTTIVQAVHTAYKPLMWEVDVDVLGSLGYHVCESINGLPLVRQPERVLGTPRTCSRAKTEIEEKAYAMQNKHTRTRQNLIPKSVSTNVCF
jgi:hypothetical protein